jgi:hypothetical protein
MSNTYKVIIAILAISILSGSAAIFINSQSRVPINQLSTASSSVQENSSQVGSPVSKSSSVITTSSSIQSEVVKSVEEPKAVVSNLQSVCKSTEIIIVQLVNENNLCFGLINWDNESLNSFDEKEKILSLNKQMSSDYYKKIQSKFISKFNIVNVIYYKVIDQNSVEVTLSMQDTELLLKKYPNLTEFGGPLNLNQAKYSIKKNPSNYAWNFQFIKFEESNN